MKKFASRLLNEEKFLGLLLVLPALIFLLIFSVYPIIRAFHMSLRDIGPMIDRGFVGLDNYIDLLTGGRLWGSLGATIYFGIGSIISQVGLALAVAVALNKNFKGRKFVRALIIVPWAIPTAMSALMWNRFFHPIDGFVNAMLRYAGLLQGDLRWFSSPILALTAVLIADAWKFTPLFIMIFLAALQAIPDHYYEAAMIEGCSSWQMFRHITVEIIKPTIVVALIMKTIFVLHAFEQIYIMTGGGPGAATRILPFYAYQEVFSYLNYGRGAAVAFILFLITLVLTLFYYRFLLGQKD